MGTHGRNWNPSRQSSGLVRLALLASGWLLAVVGWAGVFLPILPGVPFLLLATACFARSSPRAERWLLENRFIGPTLVRWRQTGTVDPRTKVFALGCVVLTFALAVWRTQSWLVRAIWAVGGLALTLWLSRYLRTEPSLEHAAAAREQDAASAPGLGPFRGQRSDQVR